MNGQSITNKSFQIIEDRLGVLDVTPEQREIIIRIAHTTGDVEFAKTFNMTHEAIMTGVDAIKRGRAVVTDVEMVRTGIRKQLIPQNQVLCFLNDPEVVEAVKHQDTTRSALAMRKAGSVLNEAVVAIGNAPTALFTLMEMIDEGLVTPSLIVGVPVGFVGALESKVELSHKNYTHITNLSERGGSPIAAAIVNGLIVLANR
ncbi:precorrin-8X methylmutase [Spirochaeta cellobiosiphila]|uniref:precorrin-8X methylmutase n=1 Tax=Spirochaeta cellobiosiphila TaxID=504483 RepID=UPI0003F56E9E|nr:precorrin-8X methylmutase [Spirochaeta cellobiosiphila]